MRHISRRELSSFDDPISFLLSSLLLLINLALLCGGLCRGLIKREREIAVATRQIYLKQIK